MLADAIAYVCASTDILCNYYSPSEQICFHFESIMNAESAAFVPSASRGRKPLSNAAGSDSTINGQDTTPSSTHTNASSKIPRSTSAHNTPALGSAAGDANKFGHHSPTTTTTATGQSSSTSSHSRSASLPGHGGTSSSRGRGSSSSRELSLFYYSLIMLFQTTYFLTVLLSLHLQEEEYLHVVEEAAQEVAVTLHPHLLPIPVYLKSHHRHHQDLQSH